MTTSPHAISCSILLLAGGRGSRMGGQDKGLVTLNGKAMISYLLQTVRPFSDDIMISCNRNQQQYGQLDCTLVSDGNRNFSGPLAGILSGLKAAQHSHLLVLPCDTPAVTPRLIQRLLNTAAEYPNSICMADDGQRSQPLHAVIPVKYRQSLQDYLNANQFTVMTWYAQQPVQRINCQDLPGDFANANRPEELTVLAATLKAKTPQ